jgi:hypothetical protein
MRLVRTQTLAVGERLPPCQEPDPLATAPPNRATNRATVPQANLIPPDHETPDHFLAYWTCSRRFETAPGFCLAASLRASSDGTWGGPVGVWCGLVGRWLGVAVMACAHAFC